MSNIYKKNLKQMRNVNKYEHMTQKLKKMTYNVSTPRQSTMYDQATRK